MKRIARRTPAHGIATRSSRRVPAHVVHGRMRLAAHYDCRRLTHLTERERGDVSDGQRFDPCPGYAEAIEGIVIGRYELNCAVVPALTPGESRTFAMELSLINATRVDDGTFRSTG